MNKSKIFISLVACIFMTLLVACKSDKKETKVEYTCPMHPEIIKDKPGQCPICGMDLVKKETSHSHTEDNKLYVCPMECVPPQNKPGKCSVCGMDLVPQENAVHEMVGDDMDVLLSPANNTILSQLPLVTIKQEKKEVSFNTVGFIDYDSRYINTLSSKVSGRVEKLYVRYRFQHVHKGDKILDIYSPELLTAQQDLLFLYHNDSSNRSLMDAARNKLLLSGMTENQLQSILHTGKPLSSVSVYSNYSGHIHEAGNMMPSSGEPATQAMNSSYATENLALKEGMYVQKGQPLFQVYNTSTSQVIINLYNDQVAYIKKGTPVTIYPETMGGKSFEGVIGFIEPVFRGDNKTTSARIYFDNSRMDIPVGSQVKATIHIQTGNADWLPEEAVITLGLKKVVFQRTGDGFVPKEINTGLHAGNYVQVSNGGLGPQDSVVSDARYLMDSESFIKVKRVRSREQELGTRN